MIELVKKLLSYRFAVLSLIFLISIGSLAAALVAQLVFNLEPCILCLYQRIPFIMTGILSLIALLVWPLRDFIIPLCALAFLGNAGLAFYHFGVEEIWWLSAFESCAVPDNLLTSGDANTLLDQLLKAPNVPCTQVAWIDPIFGMSMAFYNIWLCTGMAVLCISHLLVKNKT